MDTDVLLRCDHGVWPSRHALRRRWWPLCSPQINMFNLMSNCCSWVSQFQQPIRKVTVLMVGLDNAGKTSMIRGILKVPPREVAATPGCLRTELRVDNYVVTLLDVGGGPEARGLWRNHCGEAHGIVFVVDSSDWARVPEAKELLVDMLKQPRVAGKPLLLLANKQDKTDALLTSELIEALSLEKLVNQSRSLCHIEPCSALVDPRRWSDRKMLRGLRWLLRSVCLDYPELCARIARDGQQPLAREKERRRRAEKGPGKPKEERLRSSKTELRHRGHSKEKTTPRKSPGGKRHPIHDILKKESTLKKRLKKKKPQAKKKDETKSGNEGGEEEEEEEDEEEDGRTETESSGQKEDKCSSSLLPRNGRKLKHGANTAKEENLEAPEMPKTEQTRAKKGKGEKKKKKTVKVKKKNKINSEEIPASYSQPVDLSATFDLYRKAILALKARQDIDN